MPSSDRPCYVKDLEQTSRNRDRLLHHPNLLHWYRKLYSHLFDQVPGFERKKVLEIGSGMSPLKMFYPHVTTSDVLDLEYLDHVFDCHEIDQYGGFPDHSFDIVTLTNVLHHLRNPLEFLTRTTVKLKHRGELILVEPYCSLLSFPLYRLFHHEGFSFAVDLPGLDNIDGPLSSANQAVPYMLFFSRPEWLSPLAGYYDIGHIRFEFFSSLSYAASGGISRIFPVPQVLYRALFPVDGLLARTAPRAFASFFIARMTAKGQE